VDGVVMPQMNRTEIQSHLMWQRKTELSEKEQFTINVHAALREFFFHGRPIFEQEKAKLNLYLRSISESNQFFETYEDLMVKYLNEITN